MEAKLRAWGRQNVLGSKGGGHQIFLSSNIFFFLRKQFASTKHTHTQSKEKLIVGEKNTNVTLIKWFIVICRISPIHMGNSN